MIYAIDEKTKEHSIVPREDVNELYNNGFKIVEADADGWIEWSGGEQPLLDHVECQLKDCAIHGEEWIKFRADDVRWEQPTSITAYRPILEPQAEQVKEWNGEGLPPVGSTEKNCEIVGVYSEKKHFEVVAHRGLAAVVWSPEVDDEEGEAYTLLSCHFRPIRTDRERWIEAANKAWADGQDRFTPDFCEDIFGALYDAGLARLPGE